MPPQEIPLPPALTKRYRDFELVGRGGMGAVFRATDIQLERPVAIKLLSPGEFQGGKARDRFLEEGRINSQLVHPNIVRLYDFGIPEMPFTPFMVFEFVEGEGLERILKRAHPSLRNSLDLLIEICEGLDYAHQQGIVHRDLKPENILVTRQGQAKMLDFGLAKETGSNSGVHTQHGILLGTPPYMAPEYIQGETPGPPADLYAIGVLAFLLGTGRLPFEGESHVETLRMHLRSEVPSLQKLNPTLPPEFARAVKDCLAKDPKARPKTAGDLAQTLRNCRGTLSQEEIRRPKLPNSQRESPTAVLKDAPVRAGDPGGTRALGGRGDPRWIATRLGAGMLAGISLYLVAKVSASFLSPPSFARDLAVFPGPRSAEVHWLGTPEVEIWIQEQDLGSKPWSHSPPPGPAEETSRGEAHRFRVRVPDLESGREYRAEVRTRSGATLQALDFETPKATDVFRPRLNRSKRLERAPLEVTGPSHRSYALRVKVWVPDQSDPILEVGSLETPGFGVSLGLEIPKVHWRKDLRIEAEHRLPGEERTIHQTLSVERNFLEIFVRESLQSLEPGAPTLTRTIEAYLEAIRASKASDPIPLPTRVLEESVLGGHFDEVSAALGGFFSDREIPVPRKIELERLLAPLDFFDTILVGHRAFPHFRIRELRKEYLPYGTKSTIPGHRRSVSAPWTSKEQDPESPHPRIFLFPSDLSADGARRFEIVAAAQQFGPEDLEAWERRGRLADASVEIVDPVLPHYSYELEIFQKGFEVRGQISLEFGQGPPLVLYAPSGIEYQNTGSVQDNVSVYYRIPHVCLRRGLNRLRFRLLSPGGSREPTKPIYIDRLQISRSN